MGGILLEEEVDTDEVLVKSVRKQLSSGSLDINVYDEASDAVVAEQGEMPDTTPSALERMASKKATGAMNTLNKKRKRDTSIKRYSRETLVLYFMRNTEASPWSILKIIEDEQRRRVEGIIDRGSAENFLAYLSQVQSRY